MKYIQNKDKLLQHTEIDLPVINHVESLYRPHHKGRFIYTAQKFMAGETRLTQYIRNSQTYRRDLIYVCMTPRAVAAGLHVAVNTY